MSQLYFLSFSDHRLYRSKQRLEKQAQSFQLFDQIIMATPEMLDESFQTKYQSYLKPEVTGFGYWCWKPQIVWQTLQQMNENDIMLYCDVGCHLNVQGKKRMLEYIELVKQSNMGILAFQPKPFENLIAKGRREFESFPLHRWTKGDLLDYFNVRNRPDILQEENVIACSFFIQKKKASLDFVKQWISVFEQDFSLIDNSPSKSANMPDFIEHRHDQSIYTLLCIQHQVPRISYWELWYPIEYKNPKSVRWADWKALRHMPIQHRRDKDFGLLKYIKRRVLFLSGRLQSSWKKIVKF